MVNAFKFIFLMLGIHYGFVCFGRLYLKKDISSVSIMLMSLGITGFIMYQWVV